MADETITLRKGMRLRLIQSAQGVGLDSRRVIVPEDTEVRVEGFTPIIDAFDGQARRYAEITVSYAGQLGHVTFDQPPLMCVPVYPNPTAAA